MYYIVIAAIILIDQITKTIIRSNLEVYQSIAVFEGVLNFTYIHNYGAAFSILQNRQAFLITLTAVISAVIFVMLVRNMKYAHWTMLMSFSMIIGGGAGNMIDRIKDGYVVDFLEITLFSFPVFNVADMAVVGGSILLVINILFFDKALKVKRDITNGE